MQQINGVSEAENSGSNVGVPKTSGGTPPNKLDDYIRPTTVAVRGLSNQFSTITFKKINWWYETYKAALDTLSPGETLTWQCGHGLPGCPLRQIVLNKVDPKWALTSTPMGQTHLDAAVQLLKSARVCVNGNVQDATGNIGTTPERVGTQTDAAIVVPFYNRFTMRTKGHLLA